LACEFQNMPVFIALKNLKFQFKYAEADESKDSGNMKWVSKFFLGIETISYVERVENRDKMMQQCDLIKHLNPFYEINTNKYKWLFLYNMPNNFKDPN
jgi:hypothetical protein